MLEWIESIGNFFINVGEFIASFFKNVIEIVLLVLKGVVYATTVIAFLPVEYQAVLLALIMFSVIVTIIHFGG